jgi:exosortase A-associated hydrolase 2
MHPAAVPFFLDTARGQRFGLFHAAAGACRGALLYVHPFGEEMNKARRMAALQARALAARGFAVLLLDLGGCGDSDGEFGDARWEDWLDDLADGSAWLQARVGQPVGLWGLRLGALLALDYARRAAPTVAQLLLWQPVLKGAPFLTQFLRLRLAGAMLDQGAAAQGGTSALRAALAAGESLEVGGYLLSPALAHAIDAADAGPAPACPVHWFELAASERALPVPAATLAAAWRAQGRETRIEQLICPPFWSTQEIAECPALAAATCAALEGHANGS